MGVISDKKVEILELQKENINLKVGIVNQLNQQQLKLNELEKTYSQIKKKRFLTQDDIKSLERIVEVEASNQGIRGKVLVACVVLNRYNNSKNKTVNQIITSPGQFQPVRNGKYYSVIPTQETKEAVNMAIYKDYSNGSLYFLDPKISDRSNVRWFRNNLRPTIKYKNHEFYTK